MGVVEPISVVHGRGARQYAAVGIRNVRAEAGTVGLRVGKPGFPDRNEESMRKRKRKKEKVKSAF